MQNPTAYGLTVLSEVDPASDLHLIVYGRPEAQQRLVNARELHAVLGVGKDYTTWVKERIGKHRFTHNTDYVMLQPDKNLLPKIGEQKKQHGGHNRTEYAFSLDAAKIVAMGTNNEVGDKIKRYFLYCEKIALGLALPTQPTGPKVPPMEYHLKLDFQRKQSRSLQAFLKQFGANTLIRYGADSCRAHTGMSAREVQELGKRVGLASSQRTSARETLRHLAPAVACAMSLADAMVEFGADKQAAHALAAQHHDLFAGMMDLGLNPTETTPGARYLSMPLYHPITR